MRLGCLGQLSAEATGQLNPGYAGEICLPPYAGAIGPLLEESNFRGHNLVRYGGQFYAVPISLGPLDLAADESRLAEFLSAENLEALRASVNCLFANNDVRS